MYVCDSASFSARDCPCLYDANIYRCGFFFFSATSICFVCLAFPIQHGILFFLVMTFHFFAPPTHSPRVTISNMEHTHENTCDVLRHCRDYKKIRWKALRSSQSHLFLSQHGGRERNIHHCEWCDMNFWIARSVAANWSNLRIDFFHCISDI